MKTETLIAMHNVNFISPRIFQIKKKLQDCSTVSDSIKNQEDKLKFIIFRVCWCMKNYIQISYCSKKLVMNLDFGDNPWEKSVCK